MINAQIYIKQQCIKEENIQKAEYNWLKNINVQQGSNMSTKKMQNCVHDKSSRSRSSRTGTTSTRLGHRVRPTSGGSVVTREHRCPRDSPRRLTTLTVTVKALHDGGVGGSRLAVSGALLQVGQRFLVLTGGAVTLHHGEVSNGQRRAVELRDGLTGVTGVNQA